MYILTNGGFDTDTTGWSPRDAGSVLSIAGGRLKIADNGDDHVGAYQAFDTVIGTQYKASVETFYDGNSKCNTGGLIIGTTPNTGALGSSYGAAGLREIIFTATETTTYIGFDGYLSDVNEGYYLLYDNALVVEWP